MASRYRWRQQLLGSLQGQLQGSSRRPMGLPIQQLPIAIIDAAGLEQRGVHPRAMI